MDVADAFGCVATHCTLLPAACADRWRKAQTPQRYDANHPRSPVYLADCRNCPDGAERARLLPEPPRVSRGRPSWGHKKPSPASRS